MISYEVVERSDDYVILRLRGELAGDLSATGVERALEEHYVDDGVQLIRVDLSPVRFITVEGIQILLSLWRESLDRGKRFRAEGAQGQVLERLRVAGVMRLLDPDD